MPRRVHPAQMEILRVRLRMTKGKGLTTTNRNVVRGFSLVPGLGLHDLKRSHYRRVGSSGGEIAALPHSLCSGLRLTAMTWRWRERMSKLASLRLFITLVRLSPGTKSTSTSWWRLISRTLPARHPVSCRGIGRIVMNLVGLITRRSLAQIQYSSPGNQADGMGLVVLQPVLYLTNISIISIIRIIRIFGGII